jgi:hypothetical protein
MRKPGRAKRLVLIGRAPSNDSFHPADGADPAPATPGAADLGKAPGTERTLTRSECLGSGGRVSLATIAKLPSVKAATLGTFLQRTDASRCGTSAAFGGTSLGCGWQSVCCRVQRRRSNHDSRLAEGQWRASASDVEPASHELGTVRPRRAALPPRLRPHTDCSARSSELCGFCRKRPNGRVRRKLWAGDARNPAKRSDCYQGRPPPTNPLRGRGWCQ